jgi:hypothetical protein
MSRRLIRWIEIADERQFCGALTLRQPQGKPENHVRIGEAIVELLTWFHQGVSRPAHLRPAPNASLEKIP